jgi:hypothetical protein
VHRKTQDRVTKILTLDDSKLQKEEEEEEGLRNENDF